MPSLCRKKTQLNQTSSHEEVYDEKRRTHHFAIINEFSNTFLAVKLQETDAVKDDVKQDGVN